MNMDVAQASDARLSMSADSPDDVSSGGTHGELLPREGSVDARPTTSDGDGDTGERHEEAARYTSRADGPRIPQIPLAFTIDFGDKEVDTARYQNLFERYNARHRRNLSTSKVLNIYVA